MTFKVNRHKVAEEYNTTSSWLSNHFTTRYSHTEKFATIEEKMEDIKSRVGFDKISGIEKSAGCGCGSCDACSVEKCDCGKCEKCLMGMSKSKCNCGSCPECMGSYNISDHDLSDMGVLKTYIIDIISDPIVPNTVSNVVSKCRENEKISGILNKVKNKALLTDYIKDQFTKCKKESYMVDGEVSYEPRSKANGEALEENKPAYVGYGSYE
jgi:hypothetical protein